MLCRVSSRLRTIPRICCRAFSGGNPIVEVKTPGTPPGQVPDLSTQGVGREYEEYVASEVGRQRFNEGPIVSKFGTFEQPSPILSDYSSRIVGCVGGMGNPHELAWFELRSGKKHMCALCGQFFSLVKQIDASYEIINDDFIAPKKHH